ncbi:MAG: response regulator [Campylobacterota bacterium]|nr:response regulator [Campylobacterota bacterium]
MLDTDFLRTLNILYVEDDEVLQKSLSEVFKKVFKTVMIASNGVEALELYNNKENIIDVVVSDITMPDMTGIELLKTIRKVDKDIPFIITSAHTESEYFIDAIDNDVSYFAVKPVNVKKLITRIGQASHIIYEHKVSIHNYNEAQEYLKIIDKVAIVSKTDLRGNITFVNDIFCDMAGYTKEELIGQPHSIVRHEDMPSSAFKDLWETIKKGEEWSGKVKNKAKDGEPYNVNATIFPLYDELDTEVRGYMAIRFLTTADENEKREFKTQVRELVKKSNADILELKKENSELKSNINSGNDISLIDDQLKLERKKNSSMSTQIKYYEETIKEKEDKMSTQVKTANDKISKFYKAVKVLQTKIQDLEKTIVLKDEDHLKAKEESILNSEEVIRQHKIISDLREVIEHREDQLGLN